MHVPRASYLSVNAAASGNNLIWFSDCYFIFFNFHFCFDFWQWAYPATNINQGGFVDRVDARIAQATITCKVDVAVICITCNLDIQWFHSAKNNVSNIANNGMFVLKSNIDEKVNLKLEDYFFSDADPYLGSTAWTTLSPSSRRQCYAHRCPSRQSSTALSSPYPTILIAHTSFVHRRLKSWSRFKDDDVWAC